MKEEDIVQQGTRSADNIVSCSLPTRLYKKVKLILTRTLNWRRSAINL
jgi:hypothetical protein